MGKRRCGSGDADREVATGEKVRGEKALDNRRVAIVERMVDDVMVLGVALLIEINVSKKIIILTGAVACAFACFGEIPRVMKAGRACRLCRVNSRAKFKFVLLLTFAPAVSGGSFPNLD